MTAAMVAASVPEAMRSIAPSIRNSIAASGEVLLGNRACRAFFGSAFSGDTTTAGANIGASSGTERTSNGLRASRRHVNNCCGVRPCRSATSETTAPGISVSSRIRARSSALHRRRPIARVITSKRRTSPSGSSLGSSLDTKRSLQIRIVRVGAQPAAKKVRSEHRLPCSSRLRRVCQPRKRQSSLPFDDIPCCLWMIASTGFRSQSRI